MEEGGSEAQTEKLEKKVKAGNVEKSSLIENALATGTCKGLYLRMRLRGQHLVHGILLELQYVW